jgi:hypothetical protein
MQTPLIAACGLFHDFLASSDSIALDHAERIRDAAVEILQQGEDLMRSLSAESYARRVPVAFNACIGGHYRHCLDHFTSVFRGVHDELIDYDHRDRDARIESDPDFALNLTSNLRGAVERLPIGALGAEVTVRCEVSYAHGNSPLTRSTVGRELAYCIAHTIHHFALIAIMARLMEITLPTHFGVAPSTVVHLKNQVVSAPTVS